MSSFSVALDSFVTTNLVHPSQMYETKTYGVSEPLALSDLAIKLPTDGILEDIHTDEDTILVVCGGYRNRLTSLPRLNAILAEASNKGATLCGIWNGAFYLADAGVLHGAKVSIHQDNLAVMEEQFPELELSSSPYTVDDDRMTCAGPNSVLDMMLKFIGQHHGSGCSQAVDEVIGRDRNRNEGAPATSPLLSKPHVPKALKESVMLMENNVDEPLGVDELTQLVGISRRQMERLFRRHTGVSPGRYYMELRLTRARQLLQQSSLSITEISVACGFVSSTHFSRSYRRFFGQPPIDARRETDED